MGLPRKSRRGAEKIRTYCSSFQSQKDHEQINTSHHKHHAHAGKKQQGVISACTHAGHCGAVHRKQHDERCSCEQQSSKQEKERVHNDGFMKTYQSTYLNDLSSEHP